MGRCVSVNGVPTCVCPNGYQGENCQLSMEMTTASWSKTGARVMRPHWSNLQVGLTVALSLAGLITIILIIIYFYCLLRRRQSRLRMDTLGLIDRQRNIYVTSEEMKRSSDSFSSHSNSIPHVMYAVSGPLNGAHTNLAFTNDDVSRNRQSIISEDIYTEVDEGVRGVTQAHDADGYLRARISTESTPSIISRPSRSSNMSVTSGASESNNSMRSQMTSYSYIPEETHDDSQRADGDRASNTSHTSEQNNTINPENVCDDSAEGTNQYAEPADVVSNYAVIPEDGEECDEEDHREDTYSLASFEHDYHYIPSRMTPDSIVACSASESEPVGADVDHAYDYIPHISLSDSDRPHMMAHLDGQRQSNVSTESNTHALAPEIWDSDSDIVSITDSLEDDYDHVSPRGKYRANIADCTLSDISDLDDLDGSADNSYDFIPSPKEGMPYISAGSDSVFGQISGELDHEYEVIPDRRLTYTVATPPDAQSTPVKAHRNVDDPIYANLPDLLMGAASIDSMPFDSLEENGTRLSGDIIDVLKSAPISRQESINSAYADVELTTGNTAEIDHVSENVYESRMTIAQDNDPTPVDTKIPLDKRSNQIRHSYTDAISVLNEYCDGEDNHYESMEASGDILEQDSLDCIDDISQSANTAVGEEGVQKTSASTSIEPLLTQSTPAKPSDKVPPSELNDQTPCRDARWRFNDSLDGDTSFSSTDDDSDYEHVCSREELGANTDTNWPSQTDLPAVHKHSVRISNTDAPKRSQSQDRSHVHFGNLQLDPAIAPHVASEV